MNPAYQALEMEFVIRKVCMALTGSADGFVMRTCASTGTVGTRDG